MSDIPMPSWIKPRIDWIYVGWIPRNPVMDLSFEELVEDARRSDHGELREVDIYPKGAVCWMREVS